MSNSRASNIDHPFTVDEANAAYREGWGLYNHRAGYFRIEEHSGMTEDQREYYVDHVMWMAAAGSELHLKAWRIHCVYLAAKRKTP